MLLGSWIFFVTKRVGTPNDFDIFGKNVAKYVSSLMVLDFPTSPS